MIGDEIRRLRLRKGMSLTQFAERAEVAKSYLSNVERNIQTNPSVHILKRISSALGVPFEVLLRPERDVVHEELDPEWRDLLHNLIESGIPKRDMRVFLDFTRWRLAQERQLQMAAPEDEKQKELHS
ncbi:XRE family transcriptional regulator [Gorillibacterium massiliense]|uniref:XRE family transcriptional regulator n=1 Tax=Gorillibacterium massiliense TaxID=1280390 RepID=UPI0004B9D195|nr:XRE family transcriptional regulator [Gorillibacterium massiliense]